MTNEIQQLTPSGRIQCPSYSLVANWVNTAWNQVDTNFIIRLFKYCGISVVQDGLEDERIFDYDWVENPENQHKHGNYIFEINNNRSHENNLDTNSDSKYVYN